MDEQQIGLEEQSIEELKSRVYLGSALIKMLYQDDDPRATEAIKRLQEQQRVLNQVLVAKIKAEREVEPPPIVVGCKPAVLSAKARGSPGRQVVDEDNGSTTVVLHYS